MATNLPHVGIFMLVAAAMPWRISVGVDVHVVLFGCLFSSCSVDAALSTDHCFGVGRRLGFFMPTCQHCLKEFATLSST